MFKRLAVALALILGIGVFVVPPASAASVGTITIYRDHNYVGSLYTWAITGGCENGRQIVAYILTYEIQRASSIRFLAGGIDNRGCNFLSVRSAYSNHPYWGTCVNSLNWGYNFGQGYNDNSDAWVLEHRNYCPNYYG